MTPICKFFVPELEFHPSCIPAREQRDFFNLLAVAKLLVTNAKQATDAFLHSKFSLFDPIVHENSCQIRALRVICLASCQEALEEAETLKKASIAAEQALGKLQNKAKIPAHPLSFEELISSLNLSLKASPRMIYLLQAYFLTIGKVFQMRSDGSETAYIDYSTLKNRVSKQIETKLLQKIVDFSQAKLAELSIAFIQDEARQVDGFIAEQLGEPYIHMVPGREEESLARPCSCAFYNFKTVLLRAGAENVFIFVKKYAFGKEKSFGIFYRASDNKESFAPLSDEEARAISPKAPVFVIEGFLPDSMNKELLQQHIAEVSLLDLALANVALVPQFSSRDIDPQTMDSRAYEEISAFRKKGQELGCSLIKPLAFTIVHTHAGAAQECL